MKVLLDAVRSALDVLCSVSGGRDAAGLAACELVAVNDALGMLRRSVEAASLPVAAEIARQSRPELGGDSLAKRQGFRTAGVMISATTGTSVGEALRMVAVGEAIAPRLSLSGETAPAKHPDVASAVNAGVLGAAPASAIITMLDKVSLRVDRASVEAMEARLVEAAPGLTWDQLRTLIVRGEALLDPDGVEPHESELRDGRSVSIRQEPSGAITVSGRFDPEAGAPIVAALDGIVSGMLRRGEDGTSVAVGDPRSIRQMRADALTELCRHSLGCDDVPTGVSTTVVVRMDLSDLRSGAGHGCIDGLDQPVSASTVRRMAADAQLIPCVLGGESEILDWGRMKRLFTPAQKLALVERDGGCAFCGLPPQLTVAHHIEWWSRDIGATDLSNGILLCTTCHHRIHDDGWGIRIDAPGESVGGTGTTGATRAANRANAGAVNAATARVWFIPPPWLDATRRPRLGGRARFDLTT